MRGAYVEENTAAPAFQTIVCGVDSSPQSREAMRQALALAPEDAEVHAVAVWDPREALAAGIHASAVAGDLRRQAASALQSASQEFARVHPLLVKGPDVAGLIGAITNLGSDLICLGAHGRSRTAGIVFGSVATAMVRHAPCSVLIAREPPAERFPHLIVYATDGSADALAAARVAAQIAAKHDATVLAFHVSDGGDGGDIAEGSLQLLESLGREPVVKVEHGSAKRRIVETAASAGASLVVVGSRGRTGLAALGSVSEHVAHRAPCSVLVVREAEHPARDEGFAA